MRGSGRTQSRNNVLKDHIQRGRVGNEKNVLPVASSSAFRSGVMVPFSQPASALLARLIPITAC